MKKIAIFMILLSVSTIIMGIGYAAIDNVTLELSGNTSVKKVDNVRITKVEYKSDLLANKEESKINHFNKTTINSKIVLGDDIDSTISYEVTLRNDTDSTYKYVGAVNDNSKEFYDNDNIEYEVDGIDNNELLLPDTEKVVILTFKYKSEPIDNQILNSYINIKFIKIYNIEYVNIDSNDLISTIGEDENANIEFKNLLANIEVTGDLDYEYNNGILSISNVASDIKITGIKGKELYSKTSKNIKLGSKVNPNDLEDSKDDITGTYLKYTVNSDNKVVQIDICKTGTSNAKEVCLTAVDTNKYSSNKGIMNEYFGNTDACEEEDNDGTLEYTCSNSYVVLACDDAGGIFINDIENKKSCVINPMFGIYSCK